MYVRFFESLLLEENFQFNKFCVETLILSLIPYNLWLTLLDFWKQNHLNIILIGIIALCVGKFSGDLAYQSTSGVGSGFLCKILRLLAFPSNSSCFEDRTQQPW